MVSVHTFFLLFWIDRGFFCQKFFDFGAHFCVGQDWIFCQQFGSFRGSSFFLRSCPCLKLKVSLLEWAIEEVLSHPKSSKVFNVGSTLEGAKWTLHLTNKTTIQKVLSTCVSCTAMCLEMFKDIKRKCSIAIFVIKVRYSKLK